LVCVTQGENVLCNKNIDLSGICPCNHEEADTRLFVHVKHAAIQGLKTSLVVISVTQTNLDGFKDAIRSARKENNFVLFSLTRRKLFQDFGVMPEPTTFRRIPVLRSFFVCDFKLFSR
jgi:hypothetical protein